jgi:hypothetical protein
MNSSSKRTGIPRLRSVVVLSAVLAGGAVADGHSPLAGFEAQNAANRAKAEKVRGATTAMELAEVGLLDEARAQKIDALPPDQRSQYLEMMVQEADVRIATAERVDGDRAVVLLESPLPGGNAEIALMEKRGDEWVKVDHSEPFHPVVTGARGSFEAAGAVDMDIDGALVEKGLWSAGEITMMDRMGKVLTGEAPPALTVTLPTCPEAKSYALTDSMPSFSAAFVEGPTFDAQAASVTVTSVEGDRASGQFEMEMVGSFDETQSVSIEGSFSDVPIACDGNW